MHTPHPTPLDPPLAISMQKPSKEYGIFQLLGTINFVLVYKKTKSKGGGEAQCPPKYATGSVANVKGDIAQMSFSIIWLPISILRFTLTFSGA